jgi:hypothetical protein
MFRIVAGISTDRDSQPDDVCEISMTSFAASINESGAYEVSDQFSHFAWHWYQYDTAPLPIGKLLLTPIDMGIPQEDSSPKRGI